jgi:hypothetical protein
MAKGYNKQVRVNIPSKDEKGNSVYITTTGKEVRYVGVSQLLLDKVRTSVILPDPPTYEVTTAAGEIEVHEHNETTLETEEEKAAWEHYQALLHAAQEAQKERLIKLLLMKGIDFDMPVVGEGDWLEMQEFLGLEIPEKNLDRRYHYIMTELVGTPEDLAEIMEGVMRKSGVPEEALAEARKSFRGALEKYNTPGGPADQEGKLDS